MTFFPVVGQQVNGELLRNFGTPVSAGVSGKPQVCT